MFKKVLPLLLTITFIILMLLDPNTCKQGAANGLLLCGRVIIPSLFPFTVCTLLLMRSEIIGLLKFLDSFSAKHLHINSREFTVFLLSMIGGYPVGAKLIEELAVSNSTDRKQAGILLCCCVNAGPAFTVLAVGSGVFSSHTVGYCLLASHLLSSILLIFLLRRFLKPVPATAQKITEPFSERFVSSAADASSAMISICAYVILFSCINSYLQQIAFLKPLSFLTEVTSAVFQTRNIYLTAFLLGFGGFSIWFQIFSVCKTVKKNYLLFALFRILHGAISVALMYLILNIFKINISTVSNNIKFTKSANYSGFTVSVALFIMVILLIISLFGKNRGRNLRKELL